MMVQEVIVYVEGPSDKSAMEALLAPLLKEKREKGVAINFFEAPKGDKKKSVLIKVPQRALSIIRHKPHPIVIAICLILCSFHLVLKGSELNFPIPFEREIQTKELSIDEILLRLSQYCAKFANATLNYICDEEIEETIYTPHRIQRYHFSYRGNVEKNRYVYDYQGKVELGYQTTNEALNMAEESGDTYSVAMAYMCHGYSCLLKGFLIEAERYSLRSIDICERISFIGVLNYALEQLCEIYFELGEHQKSEHYHDKLKTLQEQGIHSPLKSKPFIISRAKSELMNDKRDFNLYGYLVRRFDLGRYFVIVS